MNLNKTKLLILSIGRDIVASAEKQLGRKADAVVSADEVRPEDYPGLRKQVYHYLKEWQAEPIGIVFSGPLPLAFTLGQIVGINHFDVTVYQYDSANRTYLSVPMPTRKEIL